MQYVVRNRIIRVHRGEELASRVEGGINSLRVDPISLPEHESLVVCLDGLYFPDSDLERFLLFIFCFMKIRKCRVVAPATGPPGGTEVEKIVDPFLRLIS